jgi:hypothetical protein
MSAAPTQINAGAVLINVIVDMARKLERCRNVAQLGGQYPVRPATSRKSCQQKTPACAHKAEGNDREYADYARCLLPNLRWFAARTRR